MVQAVMQWYAILHNHSLFLQMHHIFIQCSRAMQPNFLFSWPNARVGVASPDHMIEALTVRYHTLLITIYNCSLSG